MKMEDAMEQFEEAKRAGISIIDHGRQTVEDKPGDSFTAYVTDFRFKCTCGKTLEFTSKIDAELVRLAGVSFRAQEDLSALSEFKESVAEHLGSHAVSP